MTMENNNQNQSEQKNSFKNGWSLEEKRAIAAVVYPLIEIQKSYGRELDAKLVMQGWEAFLSDKFSGELIVYALKKYALERRDIPTPADIVEILEPKEPQISEAQYVQACKEQERNGFPVFSDAKATIEKYKQQNQKKHDDFKSNNQEILSIVEKTAKQITKK